MGSIDDFSQLCRLCLVKDQVNQSIFDESSHIGQISVKINSCLPVQVSPDDDLPKKICDGCSYKLETLYIFRNTSVESEKQLKSWLSRSQSKDHSPDVKPEETITVKEETLDSSETADLNNYLIPYEQGIEFVATTESSEPPSKRARLAPTLKHLPLEETFGSDVDNDLDLIMPVLKTEEEDSDYGNQQDFVEVPSTSAEGQTSHPGVANAAVEAPATNSLGDAKSSNLYVVTISQCDIFGCKYAFAEDSEHCNVVCETCGKRLDFLTENTYFTTRSGKSFWTRVKPCPICRKHLTSHVNVKKHMITEHRVALPNSCSFYDKTFRWQDPKPPPPRMKKKEVFHNYSEALCEICGQIVLLTNLLGHMKSKHKKYNHPQFFKCGFCKKQLKSSGGLRAHVRTTHERVRHLCENCGKEFSSPGSLQDHMRIHTGEKPFSCKFCEKTFRVKLSLRMHLRVHTKEKPYVCDICGNRYTQRAPLKLHLLAVHDGKKPYCCSVCPKKFAGKSLLNTHMKNHASKGV